MLALTCNLC